MTPRKPLSPKVKRRSLTKREKAAMYRAQDNKCADCGLYYPLEELQGEHYTPVAFGNDKKPDALWCKLCHLIKTGRDRKNIAKAARCEKKERAHRERMEGNSSEIPKGSRPRAKIQSRPFPSKEQRRAAQERMRERKESING